jgi:uncharacterized protein
VTPQQENPLHSLAAIRVIYNPFVSNVHLSKTQLITPNRWSLENRMGYYALFYREVVPDFIARRSFYREEHLGLAREAHARGELVLAGALSEPPDGALLVFRSETAAPVEDFIRKDPYVLNGLVKRWEIRPWTVVVGNQ